MLRLTDARDFRRTGTGVALITGSLLILGGNLVAPHGANERASLDALAASPVRGDLAAIMTLLGMSLIVCGAVGTMHLLRHRAVVFGNIGGLLTVVGLMAYAVAATGYFEVKAVRAVDVDAVVRIEEVMAGAAVVTVLVLALIAAPAGLLLLLIGLWRAGQLPIWPSVALFLGLAALQFGGGATVTAISSLLIVAALGSTGIAVLRMSDDSWDQVSTERETAPI